AGSVFQTCRLAGEGNHFRHPLNRHLHFARLKTFVAAAVWTLCAVCTASAITVNQLDDFQTGPDGWQSGMGPGNVSLEGGPAGDGDGFLEVNANGDFGPFSKLTIFNIQQWTGNFDLAGVRGIEIDFKNFGTSNLSMRLAFKELTGGGGYVSSEPFVVEPEGDWHHARFDLTASAFASVGAQLSFANELKNVSELRIIHHRAPVPNSLNGDTEAASVGIDNIRAVPEPSSAVLALSAGTVMVYRRQRKKRRAEE
ncbi:MAG TPA: hypothetical protein VFV83_00765, partial [Chthoniobacteraceae bacterium]|nr:hypothetical protein [Chthoniobacteraceae bacterium]